MENKEEVTFKKIPLEIFIEILTDAWQKGADYIDIIGIPDEVQDSIAVSIKEEYFSKNGREQEWDDSEDIDLNELI